MDVGILTKLLEPVQLQSTKFLQNGSVFQLQPVTTGSAENIALSITPSAYKGSLDADTINERSAVTVAASAFPCRRNTFKIIDPYNPVGEGVIKFHQDVFIQSCCPRSATNDTPLVLYSSNRIMENPLMDVDNYYRFYYTKGNLHQPVALCENSLVRNCHTYSHLPAVASTYCRWRFEHPDPEYRFEYEGEPIPLSDTSGLVLILNPATNKYLTIEEDRQRLTLIGPETCVSVQFRPTASRKLAGTWRLLANS